MAYRGYLRRVESMGSSVSAWIVGLKAGEGEAIRRLWDRYYHDLVAFARQRLNSKERQVADEEDIAVSVFDTVCRGAADGRFATLEARDDLWWLLMSITGQKVVSHRRRINAEKRGGGKVIRESELDLTGNGNGPFGFASLINKTPTPDFLVMLDEQFQRLLGMLRNDELRLIAIWRLEGFGVQEISERLPASLRTVERKLALIRQKWSQEMES